MCVCVWVCGWVGVCVQRACVHALWHVVFRNQDSIFHSLPRWLMVQSLKLLWRDWHWGKLVHLQLTSAHSLHAVTLSLSHVPRPHESERLSHTTLYWYYSLQLPFGALLMWSRCFLTAVATWTIRMKVPSGLPYMLPHFRSMERYHGVQNYSLTPTPSHVSTLWKYIYFSQSWNMAFSQS